MGTYFKVLGNPAFGTTDVPPGILVYSPVNSIGGYLLCDGSAVSRTTYADLYNIISTKCYQQNVINKMLCYNVFYKKLKQNK